MNPLICVGFKVVAALILTFGGSAKNASSFVPLMPRPLKPDIPLLVAEFCHRKPAVREFRAVNASARQKAGKLGYRNAEKLLLKDMVDPLLQIRDYRLKPLQKALGDFAEENAGLAGGVEKSGVRAAKQLPGQHIQHVVYNARRGEYLVA
jgi:hypothetical protein